MNLNKIIKTLTIFSKLASIFLFGLSIYWIYLKLTNHSPTLGELAIGISLGHLTISVPLFVYIAQSLGEIKTTMKYEFKEIKRDMYDHIEQDHK